jgi:hypothetical protein
MERGTNRSLSLRQYCSTYKECGLLAFWDFSDHAHKVGNYVAWLPRARGYQLQRRANYISMRVVRLANRKIRAQRAEM